MTIYRIEATEQQLIEFDKRNIFRDYECLEFDEKGEVVE